MITIFRLLKSSKSSLLVKFLLSYAIILIIPLAVGSFAYLEAAKMLREDVVNSNLSMLEQTRDVVDGRLSEVDKIVNQLTINTKIRSFGNLSRPLDSKEYYNARELISELRQYTVTDDFISSFFIAYKNSGIIISPTTFYDISFFYDTFFKFNDMNYDKWSSEFLGTTFLDRYIPATKVNFEDKNYKAITYVRTLLKEYSTDNVTLMLFINEKDVQKLLKKVNYYDNGLVYIVNKKGEIITSITGRDKKITPVEISSEDSKGHFQKKINGETMNVVYVNSEHNDWRYVSVVPSEIVMDRVSRIRNIALGVTFASIVVGFLIALYLSYQKSRPIMEILQMAAGFFDGGNDGNEGKKDEYEVLKNTFSNIIIKNKDLEKAIQEQEPIMKSAFLNNLLKGEYRTDAELINIMNQIGLGIEGKNFSVIMVSINGYYVNINEEVVKELAINRVIIENLISQNIDRGYTHFVDENKLAILLTYESSDIWECQRYAQNIINNISNQLQDGYTFSTVFAAGEVYCDLLQIVQSYEQSVQVLEYKLMKKDNVVLWYHQLPVEGEGYYYPIELEARIINVIKAGDYEAVKSYLKNIYEENFLKRNLSVETMIRLFHDMKDTVYKIKSETSVSNLIGERIKKLKCNGNTEEVFRIFDEIYLELCENAIQMKKNSENQLVKDILNYIEQEYMDINLSPGLVAAQFNISEAYFPHFFKAETGDTFSSFLENIRIEKACELLNTELTIKDIAEKIGYSGDKTFRRAFKRVKGVSPSEFSGRK